MLFSFVGIHKLGNKVIVGIKIGGQDFKRLIARIAYCQLEEWDTTARLWDLLKKIYVAYF